MNVTHGIFTFYTYHDANKYYQNKFNKKADDDIVILVDEHSTGRNYVIFQDFLQTINKYFGVSSLHPIFQSYNLTFTPNLTYEKVAAGFLQQIHINDIFIEDLNALFAWIVPLTIVFAVFSNLFICYVLLHKHLRSPTNMILLAAAADELIVVLTAGCWIYNYYLEGFYEQYSVGLSTFSCQNYRRLLIDVPNIFHTSAVWQMVYLSGLTLKNIRSTGILSNCSMKKILLHCALIHLISFIFVSPEYYLLQTVSVGIPEHLRTACIVIFNNSQAMYILFIRYYTIFRLVTHIVPSILILIFTIKMYSSIRNVQARKMCVLNGNRERMRQQEEKQRLLATNKIISTVGTIAFILEAFLIASYVSEVLVNWCMIDFQITDFWKGIHDARNFTIVFTSPIQFGLYCYMSEQIRVTCKQMFTKKTLYSVQVIDTPFEGKRYVMRIIEQNREQANTSSDNVIRRVYRNIVSKIRLILEEIRNESNETVSRSLLEYENENNNEMVALNPLINQT